jgi:hypothetical protein
MKRADLTGSRFGSWTALSLDRSDGHRTWWRVRCDCGAEAVVRADSLRSGGTRQCLSCQTRALTAIVTSHGMRSSPEWRVWAAMKARCSTETAGGYSEYGGRGISVCDRWTTSFEAFFEDMGPRPSPAHSIERDDVDGPYEPGNCRWATAKEQARNKRTTVFLVVAGERKSLSEWAEARGFAHVTFYKRYLAGWSDEEIVNTPRLPRTCPKPRARPLRRPNNATAGLS